MQFVPSSPISTSRNANAPTTTSSRRGGRDWHLLAIRSTQRIEWRSLTAACARADIAVADRWLPRACNPRWLKLDEKTLEETGGVAIYLRDVPRTATVAERLGDHPWAR